MRRARRASCVSLVAVALTGCGATTIESGGTAGDVPYATAMAAICAETETRLGDLPQPPGEIAVGEFATEVSRILRDEAEAARRLDAPEDLAADHRAFVANTDEQAAGWADVAQAGDATLGAETTRIAELTLGRDDLAGAMGIPACARGT